MRSDLTILNYLVLVSETSPLKVSLSMLMVFPAVVRRAKWHFERLKSSLKKLNSLKFWFRFKISIIIIIIILHGLGRLKCSGIDAMPSYSGGVHDLFFLGVCSWGRVSAVWCCPFLQGGWSSFVCIWVSRPVFQRSPVLSLLLRFLFYPALCIP